MAANAGYVGGSRAPEPYRQPGYEHAGYASGAGASMGGNHYQSQSRTVTGRTVGNGNTRGGAMMNQPMGRMTGGMRDPQGQVVVSTENLAPIPRAARTINEALESEGRYPDLDNIVSREFYTLLYPFEG